MSKPDIYTPNIEALKLLRTDSTTAWLTGDGILHVVPLFGHLDLFIDHEDLLPDVTGYLRTFVPDDGRLAISKPHMAAVMDMIYGHGWGRVGTFGGDKLELDCAREHLTELRRKAKAVARMLNRGLECRVIHPSQQKPKKARPPLARDAAWSSLVPGFAGWLSPRGELFEVPPAAPFATFVDDPDRLPEFAYALAEAIDADLQRQRSDFCEDISSNNPDGHMPWHQFWETPYNPDEEEWRVMLSSVLAHGWGHLRVEAHGRVVLLALPDHLASLAERLEALVAKADCTVDMLEFYSEYPSEPAIGDLA